MIDPPGRMASQPAIGRPLNHSVTREDRCRPRVSSAIAEKSETGLTRLDHVNRTEFGTGLVEPFFVRDPLRPGTKIGHSALTATQASQVGSAFRRPRTRPNRPGPAAQMHGRPSTLDLSDRFTRRRDPVFAHSRVLMEERLVRDREVPGSNLVAPIINHYFSSHLRRRIRVFPSRVLALPCFARAR